MWTSNGRHNFDERLKSETTTNFMAMNSIQHHVKGCTKPVSYTHLDVYKRQPFP